MVGLCLPANQRPGPGDRYIAGELAGLRKTPVMLVVTKMDAVERGQRVAAVVAANELCEEVGLPVAEVVPVSATTGENVDTVTELFARQLPPGPPLYPDDVGDR